MSADWSEQIRSHYRRNWGVSGRAIELSKGPIANGPIHELPPDFRVLEAPPTAKRDMWTYSTCCMSQPDDEALLELHLFSSRRCAGLVEILVATAHYHRTGAPLGLGHTVNFGRPWMEGSHCDHGLISLPYLDGPSLERMQSEDGTPVSFLWLLPITKSERDFKKQHGLEALELRFDEAELNYLDPGRMPVV